MNEYVPAKSTGWRGFAGTSSVWLVSLLLTACGGGGGGDGGGTVALNVPPVADAGNDRTVVELTSVQLSGSATDANGGTLTFAWTQTDGPTVTLTNANTVQASFDAPDVAAGPPVALTFQLIATDNAGATGNDSVVISVQEPAPSVTLSGVASFEFVPPLPGVPTSNRCGLDYNSIVERRIRQATVQVLDAASNTVLGSDTTDDNGNYAITVDANQNVFLRVRAELQRAGVPSWDVEVRDNTTETTLSLAQRPLYVLDTAPFDSGAVDLTRDVLAETGWDGTQYSDPRAAAPFAILDTIYDAMLLVLSADGAATFPPLDAFWSVNNSPVRGTGTFDERVASGELGTSFYSGGINSLFLLGLADQDTEEFDDHVIAHEWGHYFEDVFSRSDSIGGPHGPGDRLDMRVAFGEGWATALSGIALEEARYCDTQGVSQATGFGFNIENDAPAPRGWFAEFSVQALIYDLWDSDVDPGGADTDSIGFAPIFETMTDVQAITGAHTSIFSFIDGLRGVAPGASAFIDALLAEHDINGNGIFGDGETNDSSTASPEDVLPVYTVVTSGAAFNICSNRQFDDPEFDGNKLSEFRYLRMNLSTPSRLEFNIVTDDATVDQLPADDPNDDQDQSDPDILFRLDGQIQNVFVGGQPQGLSGEANQEIFTTPNVLPVGEYVMDLVEFRHTDDGSAADFPLQSCFDVTITPVP